MEFKIYEGRRVKIVLLDSGYIYQGIVLSVGERFIRMRDKYDVERVISINAIATLEPLSEVAK